MLTQFFFFRIALAQGGNSFVRRERIRKYVTKDKTISNAEVGQLSTQN